MVTIIGSVGKHTEASEFELHTSVYDSPTTGTRQFSVVCFFENTKRWENVVIPSSGTHVSVTAKIFGRTAENLLALRVLDFAYLTGLASTSPVQPKPSPTPLKRSYLWGGRDDKPSKKARTSEVGSGSAAPPHSPSAVDNDEAVLQLADHSSPSPTPAEPEHISDSEGRPQRRRHPPKKFPE